MRTTVRIEDDLLLELKDKATPGEVLSDAGAQPDAAGRACERRRIEPRDPVRATMRSTHSMGAPRVDLTKALSLATRLEDDETAHKTQLRK